MNDIFESNRKKRSRPSETHKAILHMLVSAALLVTVAVTGCDGGSEQKPDTTVEENLATSLHGTARGMEYWYDAEQGGFEGLTGVAYDDLSCKSCHVNPSACGTCHEDSRALSLAQSDNNCLGCHGFQGAEISAGLTDYHRDVEGLRCKDCHNANEVHGNGTIYESLYSPGAMTTRCGNKGCHGAISSNDFHTNHAGDSPVGDKMECAACHVQSVVTCYNCHFEYEVQGLGKFPFDHFKNWKLLLRRDRGDGELKIDAGNMLTATYQGKAFVAIGPYFAHTIDKNAVTSCEDCHNNEYVQEYKNTGKIVIATWNEAEGALVPNIKGKGIIPIPPQWETALEFGFATYEDDGQGPGRWVRLDPTEVGMQMLFAQPLEALPE
jgi:hypothetical protein